MIYLDNNSASLALPEVLQATQELLALPLNPSALHSFGQKAFGILELARDTVKNTLGAHNYNVFFTATGSEANNLAIKGIMADHFVCPKVEHKSVITTISTTKSFDILDVNEDGVFDYAQLLDILSEHRESRVFLSLMHANNETGVITDIKRIIKEARAVHRNLIIHSDMAQSVGKIPVDISELDLDCATIIGYKIGGLPGASALIIRPGLALAPMMFGGMQESGKRPGTENVVAIAAMAKALKIIVPACPNIERITQLRDHFESWLCQFDAHSIIFGKNQQRIGNTSFFAIPNLQAQHVLIAANRHNIQLGTGASCSAGLDVHSHVLEAMKVHSSIKKCAVRLSLGMSSTIDDIEAVLSCLKSLLGDLHLPFEAL